MNNMDPVFWQGLRVGFGIGVGVGMLAMALRWLMDLR